MARLTTIREATLADVDTIVRHRRLMFTGMGLDDPTALEAMAAAAGVSVRLGLEDGSCRG